MNFSQRYRFTNLVQKYAVNKQLWQRRLQEKEQGRVLAGAPKRQVEALVSDSLASDSPIRVVVSNPDAEIDKVDQLLRAMQQARRQIGERAEGLDAIAFKRFIHDKTQQVKAAMGCDKVQFSVSVEGGRVKFKAAKAD